MWRHFHEVKTDLKGEPGNKVRVVAFRIDKSRVDIDMEAQPIPVENKSRLCVTLPWLGAVGALLLADHPIVCAALLKYRRPQDTRSAQCGSHSYRSGFCYRYRQESSAGCRRRGHEPNRRAASKQRRAYRGNHRGGRT